MFQSTLLNKCKNMRYQKQQTENTYFQKNVHHSPLAVICWKSERLYFSMLHRLQIFVQMVLFSCIFPFYPHAVGSFRGGRLQKISPSKKYLNLSLKVAVFSRVRQQNQLWWFDLTWSISWDFQMSLKDLEAHFFWTSFVSSTYLSVDSPFHTQTNNIFFPTFVNFGLRATVSIILSDLLHNMGHKISFSNFISLMTI